MRAPWAHKISLAMILTVVSNNGIFLDPARDLKVMLAL
jgi:hypothetical protein